MQRRFLEEQDFSRNSKSSYKCMYVYRNICTQTHIHTSYLGRKKNYELKQERITTEYSSSYRILKFKFYDIIYQSYKNIFVFQLIPRNFSGKLQLQYVYPQNSQITIYLLIYFCSIGD